LISFRFAACAGKAGTTAAVAGGDDHVNRRAGLVFSVSVELNKECAMVSPRSPGQPARANVFSEVAQLLCWREIIADAAPVWLPAPRRMARRPLTIALGEVRGNRKGNGSQTAQGLEKG
jgi:hypothetical protein